MGDSSRETIYISFLQVRTPPSPKMRKKSSTMFFASAQNPICEKPSIAGSCILLESVAEQRINVEFSDRSVVLDSVDSIT